MVRICKFYVREFRIAFRSTHNFRAINCNGLNGSYTQRSEIYESCVDIGIVLNAKFLRNSSFNAASTCLFIYSYASIRYSIIFRLGKKTLFIPSNILQITFFPRLKSIKISSLNDVSPRIKYYMF